MPCTTLIVRALPELSVTDIRVSPPEVTLDQSVTIDVTVRNAGGATGSATVMVTVDGAEIERFDTGPVEAGASKTLSLTWTPPRAGTFQVCAEVV